MRKITALALCATTAGLVWGLSTTKPSAPEPGIPIHVTEDNPLWDCRTMGNKICGSGEIKAEADAVQFLHSMQSSCEAQGMAAETWVERHPAGESRPHKWYEVLGKCAGRIPS